MPASKAAASAASNAELVLGGPGKCGLQAGEEASRLGPSLIRCRWGWILERIGALYKTEKVIALEAGEDSALHLTLRKERAEPITQAIRIWALAQGGLRRGEFGKALAYTLRHWDGLTRFLEDPAVPLDNNPAERALRDLVLGRKNHYGSHSQRGADVSALFYTLIGTAKLCGLKPEEYLREAIMAALKTPGAVTLPSQLTSAS
ncbi:MAG TPA: transposase [Thermoanaerobaculia bacterium]|nr:transposase [Thermoanaerobaculia bacterium]